MTHVLTFDRIGALTNAERIRQRMPRTHRISDRDEFFRLTDAVDGAPARLDLFDEIGFWGTTAADFNAQLQATSGDTLEVHINSGGGDAFDGIAIMNSLRAHAAAVNVVVDGLAASAASYIAMGGDTLTMMPNSEMMIHDASGICVGNPADMKSMMDLLNHVSDNIADVYARRAGGTVTDWRAAMGIESWYTADEAVAAGLADKVGATRGKTSTADNRSGWNMSFYAYNGRADAPAPVITPPAAPVPAPPVFQFDLAEFRAAMRINQKEAAQ